MNKILDKFGICISGICLIHCLLTPVIIMLFPALNLSFLVSESVHQLLGSIVILSVLLAVYPHCRKHGHKDIIASALLGTVFILIALFFGHELSEVFEHGFTILGSIFLILAHIKNIKVRHGRCESTCSSESHA